MTQLDTPRSAAGVDPGGQYLTFRLGEEEYAIDILGVQEIKGYTAITPIPNAPPHIRGVINLRGTVVPVVGLRERFGMSPVDYDKFTVIVIVSVGSKVAGVVVDAVTDVLTLANTCVQAPPELGAGVDTSFMVGMAKTADRLVIVLDVERALGDALKAASEPLRAERTERLSP